MAFYLADRRSEFKVWRNLSQYIFHNIKASIVNTNTNVIITNDSIYLKLISRLSFKNFLKGDTGLIAFSPIAIIKGIITSQVSALCIKNAAVLVWNKELSERTRTNIKEKNRYGTVDFDSLFNVNSVPKGEL